MTTPRRLLAVPLFALVGLLAGADEANAQRYTPTPTPSRTPVPDAVKQRTSGSTPSSAPTPSTTHSPAPDRTWWEKTKDYGDAFVDSVQEYYTSDYIHDVLGAGGLTPGVGIGPDIADGVIHVGEAGYHVCAGNGGKAGEHLLGAGCAAVAAVPVLGTVFRGGKYADEVVDGVRGAGRILDRVQDLRQLSKREIKRLGLDPHKIKGDILGGSGNISRYNLWVGPDGLVYLRRNGSDELGELVGHIDDLD